MEFGFGFGHGTRLRDKGVAFGKGTGEAEFEVGFDTVGAGDELMVMFGVNVLDWRSRCRLKRCSGEQVIGL